MELRKCDYKSSGEGKSKRSVKTDRTVTEKKPSDRKGAHTYTRYFASIKNRGGELFGSLPLIFVTGSNVMQNHNIWTRDIFVTSRGIPFPCSFLWDRLRGFGGSSSQR